MRIAPPPMFVRAKDGSGRDLWIRREAVEFIRELAPGERGANPAKIEVGLRSGASHFLPIDSEEFGKLLLGGNPRKGD